MTHYLASFFAGQGYQLAIAEYHKAIELDFEFPDAHLNLALALAEHGRLEAPQRVRRWDAGDPLEPAGQC